MRQMVLRLFISLSFIALLFYLMRDDIPEIVVALKSVDKRLFLIAAAIFLSTVFILAKRLEIIFAAEGAPLSLSEAVRLTFVGYFFNNFLPTSVGGDIVKAMCASKVTKQPVKSVTSVLMDRIFGLFTFIMIPSVSYFFSPKENDNFWVPVIIYSFLFISLSCFFLLFNRNLARKFSFIERILNKFKLGEKARKIYDGLHAFRHRKGVMAQAMLLSIFGQGVGIYVLYLLALSLGAKTHVGYFYLLVPVVQLLSMLPSLNGLGIRESGYVYFLKPFIGKEYAFAMGILSLALLLFLSLIGAVIYLMNANYHIRFSGGKTSKAELA